MGKQAVAQCRMTIFLINLGLLRKGTQIPAKKNAIVDVLRKHYPAEYGCWAVTYDGKEMPSANAIEAMAVGFGINLEPKRSPEQRRQAKANIAARSFAASINAKNKAVADSRGERQMVSYSVSGNMAVPVSSDAFLQTYEWRRLRMEAIKKHGRACQCCGAMPSPGKPINVDHIKPRRLYPELALSLDNLQVLCHECNHGKGNWDMTDWREQQHVRSILAEDD